MPTSLIDPTLEGVARALTVHMHRHAVLAADVANVETPGYRAQEIDFRTALRDAFDSAQQRESAPQAERVIEDTSSAPRADGNTVDLDLAMAKLSDNAGRYQALTRILANRLGVLRQAIEGTK